MGSRKLVVEETGMAEREETDILSFCPHASPCRLKAHSPPPHPRCLLASTLDILVPLRELSPKHVNHVRAFQTGMEEAQAHLKPPLPQVKLQVLTDTAITISIKMAVSSPCSNLLGSFQAQLKGCTSGKPHPPPKEQLGPCPLCGPWVGLGPMRRQVGRTECWAQRLSSLPGRSIL